MLRDGLNTQLEPTAKPAVRSKRAGAALHAYGEAIGASTVQDRLARTNVMGDMRRTHNAAVHHLIPPTPMPGHGACADATSRMWPVCPVYRANRVFGGLIVVA